MEIEGCIALVTGANRGLGRAYAEALIAGGAAKVYAGARDLSSIADPCLLPVKLDVTSRSEAAAAAEECSDVNLLINNAGIMLGSPMLASGAEEAMRREMEVNVFGVQNMIRSFAPVLSRNGGGVIVNVLSVVSWFTVPFNATYCASKHAALAVTDAARIQLRSQGTRVVGVYAGFIDTDMAANIDQHKTPPRQVAERTLEGIRRGQEHVLADRRAEEVWRAMRTEPSLMAEAMQQSWDKAKGRNTGPSGSLA